MERCQLLKIKKASFGIGSLALEHFVEGPDMRLQGFRVLSWLVAVRTIDFKDEMGFHMGFDFTFVRITLFTVVTNPFCSAQRGCGFGQILGQELLQL